MCGSRLKVWTDRRPSHFARTRLISKSAKGKNVRICAVDLHANAGALGGTRGRNFVPRGNIDLKPTVTGGHLVHLRIVQRHRLAGHRDAGEEWQDRETTKELLHRQPPLRGRPAGTIPSRWN